MSLSLPWSAAPAPAASPVPLDLASLVGPVAAVVAGGLGAIGVTLLWMRFFPELRRASTFDPPDALAPGGTP